jgi:hypothetical protein
MIGWSRLRVAGWLFGAVVYGAGTSWLPAPDHFSFWAGNVSAAYLALPFLAAASVSLGWVGAAAVGVAVDWAMVAAFYARHLYDPASLASYRREHVDPYTIGHFLEWIFLDRQWFGLGALVGVAFGLLGQWWWRSRSPWLAGVAALTVAGEPVAHELDTSFGRMPAGWWVAEIAGAVVLFGVLVVAGRHPRARAVP